MFEFEQLSVDDAPTDEARILRYETIQEFINEWSNGIPRQGTFVTHDGISVLHPHNEETKKELKKVFLQFKMKEYYKPNYTQKELFNTLGVSYEQLIDLICSRTDPDIFGSYIQTKKGRAFYLPSCATEYENIFPKNNEVFEKRLPKGSLSYLDTLTFIDGIEHFGIVFDKTNIANNVQDILTRPIVPHEVLTAVIEVNEGFNDDGIYGNIRVSGTNTDITDLKNKLFTLNDENLNVHHGGYTQNKEKINENEPLSFHDSINRTFLEREAGYKRPKL